MTQPPRSTCPPLIAVTTFFLLASACAPEDDPLDDGGFSTRSMRACHASLTAEGLSDFWVAQYGREGAAFQRVTSTLEGSTYVLEYATCQRGPTPTATLEGQTVTLSFDRYVDSFTLEREGAVERHQYAAIQTRAYDLIDTTRPPVVTYFLRTAAPIEEIGGTLWVCSGRLLFERDDADGCGYGWREI